MFKRLIAIDWSGASTDTSPVDIRVAQWLRDESKIVAPPASRPRRAWTRTEALEFLSQCLSPHEPRTLVALDFAFGLPWRSDTTIFGVTGWRSMVDALANRYAIHRTARAFALAINSEPKFDQHGPYRLNGGRTDFHFYLQHSVAYYRLVELAMPQAISQWYVGAGAAVGFHTITGLAMLAKLLRLRDRGAVSFSVWPQELAQPSGDTHILVECYPAILPMPADFAPCLDGHQKDAWRVLQWMKGMNEKGFLEAQLQIPMDFVHNQCPNGTERVLFEGWTLGVIK